MKHYCFFINYNIERQCNIYFNFQENKLQIMVQLFED